MPVRAVCGYFNACLLNGYQHEQALSSQVAGRLSRPVEAILRCNKNAANWNMSASHPQATELHVHLTLDLTLPFTALSCHTCLFALYTRLQASALKILLAGCTAVYRLIFLQQTYHGHVVVVVGLHTDVHIPYTGCHNEMDVQWIRG